MKRKRGQRHVHCTPKDGGSRGESCRCGQHKPESDGFCECTSGKYSRCFSQTENVLGLQPSSDIVQQSVRKSRQNTMAGRIQLSKSQRPCETSEKRRFLHAT